MAAASSSRFLTIPEVAEELATSTAQVTALVRRGDLPALKLGGRGQWRIERAKLEAYIEQAYRDTARELRNRKQAGNEPDDLADESDHGGYERDEDYRQEEGGEG
jgi:excisionase family DNA binding protein